MSIHKEVLFMATVIINPIERIGRISKERLNKRPAPQKYGESRVSEKQGTEQKSFFSVLVAAGEYTFSQKA